MSYNSLSVREIWVNWEEKYTKKSAKFPENPRNPDKKLNRAHHPSPLSTDQHD
jgi:hypothetical protein